MRTSYSALDTYKTCPLKYKYQNIDKIKAPKNKEAVFGTVVHEALKFMFEKTPLYPTLDEVVNFL
ncbi:MAG: PD-(D/E)XK nuclease family protein [Patescibacteria group bacterium]